MNFQIQKEVTILQARSWKHLEVWKHLDEVFRCAQEHTGVPTRRFSDVHKSTLECPQRGFQMCTRAQCSAQKTPKNLPHWQWMLRKHRKFRCQCCKNTTNSNDDALAGVALFLLRVDRTRINELVPCLRKCLIQLTLILCKSLRNFQE